VFVAGCNSRGSDTKGGMSGGGADGEAKRLIILTNVPDPYWDACEAGANKAAQELDLAKAGYSVTVEQNTKGVQGQIQRLREWAGAADIAGVAVCVMDPDNTALIDAMRALKDSGVQVIAIDSDVNRDNPSFREARYGYIGTDNVAAGEELGKAAKALLPSGGKFATFVGNKAQANAIQRDTGFRKGAGDAFQQTDFLADDSDRSKARQTVRDALSRNDDLAMLVGLWAYNTPAIVDIVTEQNLGEKVKVVGFDADPDSLAAMEKSAVHALAVQNPYEMGRRSIKTLRALVEKNDATLKEVFPNYGQTDGDIHDTGVRIIVPDDSSPVKKDQLSEKTELMTLRQFRGWLTENKLKGS
jgi:ribose transport system substrate-binding protein